MSKGNTVKELRILLYKVEVPGFCRIELEAFDPLLLHFQDFFCYQPAVSFKAGKPVVALSDMIKMYGNNGSHFQALEVIPAGREIKQGGVIGYPFVLFDKYSGYFFALRIEVIPSNESACDKAQQLALFTRLDNKVTWFKLPDRQTTFKVSPLLFRYFWIQGHNCLVADFEVMVHVAFLLRLK